MGQLVYSYPYVGVTNFGIMFAASVIRLQCDISAENGQDAGWRFGKGQAGLPLQVMCLLRGALYARVALGSPAVGESEKVDRPREC